MLINDFLKIEHILWEVSDDDYHPMLSSGKHSNLYINCNKIFSNPNITLMVLNEYDDTELKILGSEVNTLCGLQTGGIILAHLLPFIYPNFNPVKVVFTSKDNNHLITRTKIKENNAPILLVDDVLTTGSNINKCLSNYNVDLFYPKILCLINRYGKNSICLQGKNFEIISAIQLNGNIWDETECPLCRQNSKAIKPKDLWDDYV